MAEKKTENNNEVTISYTKTFIFLVLFTKKSNLQSAEKKESIIELNTCSGHQEHCGTRLA